ncbi:MAG TPA: ABC transporter ATP-binding protein [Verrucomicrobiae bacterium]|jgi:molybdate transport system ATP-binding protein|nr:ABC transporter ATP-binding protein [Verrucomicrobiae bacterium]
MNPLLRADFTKKFSGGPVIQAEALEIKDAGVTVLFGPSGSGKTTILRCLAGLEIPDAGEIVFGDMTWSAQGKNLVPPRDRQIGFVPQEYALFPHLTVADNIAYGLRGETAVKKKARVAELLSWLGLDGLDARLPATLSGGQQQRVALARAVARQPKLLLLDEPLAALDTPTRNRLRGELRTLLRQLGIPTVFVTHDRLEALSLGDDLVLLDEGRIIQRGPVQEIFNRPASLTVAGIVAVETIRPARVLELRDGLATVQVGSAQLTAMTGDLPSGATEIFVCIRAEDVILSNNKEFNSSARNHLSATVRTMVSEGPLMRIELDCGFALTAVLTKQACAEMSLKEGASVFALIKAPQIHLVPRSG